MGTIFELVFPFETYLNYLKVDEELRDRLTIRQEVIFTTPDTLFPAAEMTPAWNLNGRAEETTAAHHLSLFEAQAQEITLPSIAVGASDLVDKIAALSAPREETRAAPPRIIEGEKARHLET